MSNWKYEDYTAKSLATMVMNGEILVPEYQRGQVWDDQKQKNLIDSIKKGFPFGTILLHHNKDTNEYALIDGLQRCTTIAKYINSPAIIFDINDDLDDDIIEEISILSNLENNLGTIKSKLKEIIYQWVISNHKTLSDIQGMQFYDCSQEIINHFPSFSGKETSIISLLKPMLENFQIVCNDLVITRVPAIVYNGPQELLPEIFARINTEGTKLSKYQILAASWSHVYYEINSPKLSTIHVNVEEFFTHFLADETSFQRMVQQKGDNELNLFQVLFGFSKLLSSEYPFLFSSKKGADVESAGFNLVTACLGLRNSEMPKLNNRISDLIKSPEELNRFFENIIGVTEHVNHILLPYLSFKNNKRKGSAISQYHTEMQICSIIANAFLLRFAHLDVDGKFQIRIYDSNRNWKENLSNIKSNLLKRYLLDIIQSSWSGSGDNKLNEIIFDSNYYIKGIEERTISGAIHPWYNTYKVNTNEHRNVANPDTKDKLLFSIIYSEIISTGHAHKYSFDYEHLATKDLMKGHLTRLTTDVFRPTLPISSIGNICLLPEANNRRKKGSILYQDLNYNNEITRRHLTIEEIEEKYSFTTRDSMNWILDDTQDYESLLKSYTKFIDDRFSILLEKVLDVLYSNR